MIGKQFYICNVVYCGNVAKISSGCIRIHSDTIKHICLFIISFLAFLSFRFWLFYHFISFLAYFHKFLMSMIINKINKHDRTRLDVVESTNTATTLAMCRH